jgi:hypothetical protein
MARITPQQRQRYGPLLTGSVPGEVLNVIDDNELEDRFAQASGLMQQAAKVAKAATPGAGRQVGEQAQRILNARPRAQTEKIVVAKMAKARSLGDSPQAAALERQARDELLSHPPAVRRHAAPVAKAKAAKPDDDQLMPIYDRDGNLTHVGYPKNLTPVIPGPTTQAKNTGPVKAGGTTDAGPPKQAPPAQPLPGDVPDRQVVKAAPAATPEQVIKSFGPQWMPVYNWLGYLAGAVPRSHVTALAPGQVLKGAAGRSRANVYDARRRRVGTAPLAAIVHLADLPGRKTGR